MVKVTIYKISDFRGRNHYWCCTKKHRWIDDISAAKCCSGWTAVYRPHLYCSGDPIDWGKWYEPSYPWVKILIPDFLTDEIAKLREIIPEDLIKKTTWDWEQSNIEIEQ